MTTTDDPDPDTQDQSVTLDRTATGGVGQPTPSTDPTRRRQRLDAPALPIRVVKGIVLLVICAVVIIPFIGIVSTSIASAQHVTASGGFVLWPDTIDLAAYKSILAGGVVTRALLISVGVTVVGTFVSLAGSTLLAYALSRPGSFGHGPMLMIVLLTLLFAPGLIPNYLVVKELGLLDSLWSLIVPTAINAFNVIVLRAFMGIPRELIDSARIDGADDLNVFLRIVLPLSKAVLAVIGLFYAVGYWNAFFNALLYLMWAIIQHRRRWAARRWTGSTSGRLPPSSALAVAVPGEIRDPGRLSSGLRHADRPTGRSAAPSTGHGRPRPIGQGAHLPPPARSSRHVPSTPPGDRSGCRHPPARAAGPG